MSRCSPAQVLAKLSDPCLQHSSCFKASQGYSGLLLLFGFSRHWRRWNYWIRHLMMLNQIHTPIHCLLYGLANCSARPRGLGNCLLHMPCIQRETCRLPQEIQHGRIACASARSILTQLQQPCVRWLVGLASDQTLLFCSQCDIHEVHACLSHVCNNRCKHSCLVGEESGNIGCFLEAYEKQALIFGAKVRLCAKLAFSDILWPVLCVLHVHLEARRSREEFPPLHSKPTAQRHLGQTPQQTTRPENHRKTITICRKKTIVEMWCECCLICVRLTFVSV